MIYALRGNTIRDIALPLQELIVEESGKTVTDYYPTSTDKIEVNMVSASDLQTVDVTVDGNYLHWTWLPMVTGTYGIEVKIVQEDGTHMRSYRKQQIRVYNSNDQLPDDDGEVEFISEYLVLDAVTVVWVKGDPGNGIVSIVKTSTEGLVDTYTITYTETEPTTFTVTNGKDATIDPEQIQQIIDEVIAAIDIPTALSDLTEDSTHRTVTDEQISGWNAKTSNIGTITGVTMNGASKGTSGVVDLGTVVTEETDPTVPNWAKASSKPSYTASEVGAVPTTRTVNGKALSADITLSASDVNALPSSTVIPDAQIQSDWNQSDNTKKDFIKNKPSIPAAQIQSDWNQSDTDAKDYIKNKPSIPAAQIQSDWNQADNTKLDYIKNKPTVPAAGIPSGGNAGQVLTKTDGSTDYAVAWRDTNNIFPSAYCTTAAATAAKNASCTFWTATANSYLHILITKANSNQGALTLNVNSTGAAPIYINGTVSSSTNYTLPAGSYLVFYDGTNFYFRTDGKLTANITGTADGSANVIETVKVNGVALTPDAYKAVDVVILAPISDHGTSDTTLSLTPNVWHKWGEVAALTLTLATPADNTVVNMYMFEFTSGSTATNLSLPSSIVWDGGTAPTIAASTRYEVTIQNNGAALKSFPTA